MSELERTITWMVYFAALSYRRQWWVKNCIKSRFVKDFRKPELPSDVDFFKLDLALGMPKLAGVKL